VFLLTGSKWERLIFILEVLEASSEQMKASALKQILRWIETYNRSYIPLKDEQRMQLMQKIEKLAPILQASIKRNLLFLIR
jgi:hypothetical protein